MLHVFICLLLSHAWLHALYRNGFSYKYYPSINIHKKILLDALSDACPCLPVDLCKVIVSYSESGWTPKVLIYDDHCLYVKKHRCLTYIPSGLIAAGTEWEDISIYNTNGQLYKRLKGPRSSAVTIMHDAVRNTLITTFCNKSIHMWKGLGGTSQQMLAHDIVTSLAMLEDGHLVSSGPCSTLQVWDIERQQVTSEVYQHGTALASCTPDLFAAIAETNNLVRLFDVRDLSIAGHFPIAKQGVQHRIVKMSGEYHFALSNMHLICCFDMRKFASNHDLFYEKIVAHGNCIQLLVAAGKYLLSSAGVGTIKLWSEERGHILSDTISSPSVVKQIACDQSGLCIAAIFGGRAAGSIQTWAPRL